VHRRHITDPAYRMLNDNQASPFLTIKLPIDHKVAKTITVTALSLIALVGLVATAMVVMNQLDIEIPYAEDLEPIAGYLADQNIAIGVAAGAVLFTGSSIGLGVYFFKPRTRQATNEGQLSEAQIIAIKAEAEAEAEAKAAAEAEAAEAEAAAVAAEAEAEAEAAKLARLASQIDQLPN
jgi:hypothetical protein